MRTGRSAALVSGRATEPAGGRDRGGDCPAAAAGRGHAKSVRHWQTAARAYALPGRAPSGRPQPGRLSTTAGRRPPRAVVPGRVGGVFAARLVIVLSLLASLTALPPAAAAPPPTAA